MKYGVFWDGESGKIGAHRFAWTMANGAIPDGLFVCHKCDNPRCVRHDHLFLGTTQDNSADRHAKGRSSSGMAHGGFGRSKTHCPSGHEYSPENTRLRKNRKYITRTCKACDLAYVESKKRAKMEAP